MLDLKFIRENLELVKKAAIEKKFEVDFDALVKFDDERKAIILKVEEKKARRNKASEEIAKMKKSGQNADTLVA
jgi:seryl-tRNA synthetase